METSMVAQYIPGDTRENRAKYSIRELDILAGPATHVDMFWCGSRWLLDVMWRGDGPHDAEGFRDPDGGPLLRCIHGIIEGHPPDHESFDQYPRRISSVIFSEARHVVLGREDVGDSTAIIAWDQSPLD